RIDLSYFVALLFNRVPKFEREIDEMTDATFKHILQYMFPTVEAVASHLAANPDPERTFTAEDYFRFIHDEQFTVEGNRNNTVQVMLKQTPEMAKVLAVMDWHIAHAEKGAAFITTDAAFGYLVSEEVRRSGEPVYGLASEKIAKVVSLSSRIALIVGAR